MDKIKVLLFGMTGFGNNALKVLKSSKLVELMGVFTPKRHATPFPYYDCEQLQDAVKKGNVPLYEGLVLKERTTLGIIESSSPDLIITSSFSQIMPRALISMPRLGVINIHPSLLPKYRGATPTVWVLMEGEKETGVTAHFIEDEQIDAGRIISHATLTIDPLDTDGTLRSKLAGLSEKVLEDAIFLVMTRGKMSFPLQDKSEATYYPKRTIKDAVIDVNKPFREIVNKIRAVTPHPGARLIHNNKIYFTRHAELSKEAIPCSNPGVNWKRLVFRTDEGCVSFQVTEENIKDEE